MKISRTKSDLKVLLSLKLSNLPLHYDKNETEPVWLSPVFAIFQAPPCKVIRVNAYNHIEVRPAYSKQG